METPPPLPTEEPPKSPSPPPPSIQASNQSTNRLDFANDDGGLLVIDGDEPPPAKRLKLNELDVSDTELDVEGPDTLLGSGLALELLEEGEIFDSESILSRNESMVSLKSRQSLEQETNSQEDVSSTKSEVDSTKFDDGPLSLKFDNDSQSQLMEEDTLQNLESTAQVTDNCCMNPDSTKSEPTTRCPVSIISDSTSPNKQDKVPDSAKGPSVATKIEPPSDDEHDEDEDEEPSERLLEKAIKPVLPDCDLTLKPSIPSQSQEEFEIIDDVESDLDDGGDFPDNSDLDSDDLLYDEDEIDALLDEEMEKNGSVKVKDIDGDATGDKYTAVPLQKEKLVLVEKGHDPFEILPEGWLVVTHNSGMPVYLHKSSRVCTLSKPYFLGPGSARKHDIPISAIPCLQYQRAIEKGGGAVVENGCPVGGGSNVVPSAGDKSEPAKEGAGEDLAIPKLGVRVETAEDHEKQNSLGPEEVKTYCESLFQFKSITVKRFKTWKDRRQHNNMMKKIARPALPSNTKLIRCALPSDKDDKVSKRKEFVLNPAGKSDICILHEYVQQALRVQPRYVFEELANSQTPFSATIMIEGEKYGTGFSSSKKGAKLEAAKQTLAILIPEINKLKNDDKEDDPVSDFSLFDTIKIEDPRVTELCIKAGQPGPFQVLCECLKRNYGVGDTHVNMEMKALKHQKSEFIMKVGKHEARVVCKNKREGKQQAAQSILQKMHPHIHTWGSLLRLYDRSTLAKLSKEECEVTPADCDCLVHTKVYISFGTIEDLPKGDAVCCIDEHNKEVQVDCAKNRGEWEAAKEVKDETTQTNEGGQPSQIYADDLNTVDMVIDPSSPAQATPPTEPIKAVESIPVSVEWSILKKSAREVHCRPGSREDSSSEFSQQWRHSTTQTEWEGKSMFHKATQYPDVTYSSDDKPSIISPTTPESLCKQFTGPINGSANMSSGSYQCVAVRSGSGIIIGTAPLRPGATSKLSDTESTSQSLVPDKPVASPSIIRKRTCSTSSDKASDITHKSDDTPKGSPKSTTSENQDSKASKTPRQQTQPLPLMFPPNHPGMFPFQAAPMAQYNMPSYLPGGYMMSYLQPPPGVMAPYMTYAAPATPQQQPGSTPARPYQWPGQ